MVEEEGWWVLTLPAGARVVVVCLLALVFPPGDLRMTGALGVR